MGYGIDRPIAAIMPPQISMGIKGTIKTLVEKATDTHIVREFPHGVDVFADLRRDLPRFTATTIFDVGANIGQSTEEIVRAYPAAQIFAFEPVKATFQALHQNSAQYPNVRCFNMALGSQPARMEIAVSDCSLLSTLRPANDSSVHKEVVDISTVDEFCAQNGIDSISFLKVDTEGADLEVLKGASQLLSAHRIDVVQLEAGMNPSNTLHVPLEILKQHMESHSYFLFGFYEQVNEWPTRRPNLRRTNPVFLSERVIAANTSLPTA